MNCLFLQFFFFILFVFQIGIQSNRFYYSIFTHNLFLLILVLSSLAPQAHSISQFPSPGVPFMASCHISSFILPLFLKSLSSSHVVSFLISRPKPTLIAVQFSHIKTESQDLHTMENTHYLSLRGQVTSLNRMFSRYVNFPADFLISLCLHFFFSPSVLKFSL